MDTYINVTLRAFKVNIFDNRTLETKIDVIVFDKSVLQATQLLKLLRLSSVRHSLTSADCLRRVVKSLDIR